MESPQGDHGNRPMFLTAVPEMRAQQLDIILALLRAGIRPDKVNSSGQTAAARAVGQENPFREAAILLGMLQGWGGVNVWGVWVWVCVCGGHGCEVRMCVCV